MLWKAGLVLTGWCLECLLSVEVMVGRSVVAVRWELATVWVSGS